MVQNRNKLIDLFIGNISNAITHKLLEQSTEDEALAEYYEKEISNSMEIARKYREKINPSREPLPEKDREQIRMDVVERVTHKLKERILEGYKNIDLNSVEKAVDEALTESTI